MRSVLIGFITLIVTIGTCGCTVRHYQVDKERVDQDLSLGNKGYLNGELPQQFETEVRPTTRTTYVTEIEMPLFGEKKKTAPALMTSGGETSPGISAVVAAPAIVEELQPQGEVTVPSPVTIEKYTVKRGDTLEKIAQRFYGKADAWQRILEANKEIVRSPDRIYEGQVLDIPVLKLREPKENLK